TRAEAEVGLKTVAVFSAKGGVGKTTIAVNLAHASASLGGRRTLLWDLDPQGAASWLMHVKPRAKVRARAAVAGEEELLDLVRDSTHANLAILPADRSLRRLEADLAREDKGKQLKRLLKSLDSEFDRVIIDTPPGLTELADRVLRAVDLVLVPAIPTPLSARAEEQLVEELRKSHPRPPRLLSVWSMADRRKSLHRETVASAPERPLIPYSASIEAMAVSRSPVTGRPPGAAAARAFSGLYTAVELALLRG
ncbi:MAG: ParA family protein, partial [Thermaurantiacus sp.]